MYRAYAITVRPKNGLHGAYAEELEKKIKKHSHYVYNYEEENEARHLHGVLFYEEPKRKSDIQKLLKRIAEKHDPNWGPASQKVLSGGVKIAYNDGWMDNYIQKDSEAENYQPPDNTDEYYPTQEEQDKVLNRATAKDSYYNNLKEMWGNKELIGDTHIESTVEIGKWYYDQMYKSKTIPVISDPKRFKQNIKALASYLYPDIFYSLEKILTAEETLKYNNILLYKTT